MSNEEIRIAMARLEGLEKSGDERFPFCRSDTKDPISFDTDYCKSHNAVQRIIDRLDNHGVCDFQSKIREICLSTNPMTWICKATALQKCEAMLKIRGLWS